jgi:WD40 repeat protein
MRVTGGWKNSLQQYLRNTIHGNEGPIMISMKWIARYFTGLMLLCIGAGPSSLAHAIQDISPNGVNILAWSPDGSKLAAADYTNAIRIWDVRTGGVLATLNGHTSYITALAWSLDGAKLISTSNDRTAMVWNTSSGSAISVLPLHEQIITGAIWQDNEQAITVTGGIDLTPQLRVWNSSTGELVNQVEGIGGGLLTYSPDGQILAVNKTVVIELRHSDTFELIRILTPTNPDEAIQSGYAMSSMSWSNDGLEIVTGHWNGNIQVWNVSSGEVIREFDPGTNPSWPTLDRILIVGASFDSSGTQIISATATGMVRTWDLETAAIVDELDVNRRIYGADFSPFQARIALGGEPMESTVSAFSQSSQDTLFANSAVQIVVPDPSPERLQAIAEACDAPLRMIQAASNATSQADIAAFEMAVEALPEGAIPPACAADLLAVAQAIHAQ